MAMASRIALMQAGKIAQVGSPHELYEAPASRYVAGFFGEANFFEGPGGSATMVRPEDVRIAKAASRVARRYAGGWKTSCFWAAITPRGSHWTQEARRWFAFPKRI